MKPFDSMETGLVDKTTRTQKPSVKFFYSLTRQCCTSFFLFHIHIHTHIHRGPISGEKQSGHRDGPIIALQKKSGSLLLSVHVIKQTIQLPCYRLAFFFRFIFPLHLKTEGYLTPEPMDNNGATERERVLFILPHPHLRRRLFLGMKKRLTFFIFSGPRQKTTGSKMGREKGARPYSKQQRSSAVSLWPSLYLYSIFILLLFFIFLLPLARLL